MGLSQSKSNIELYETYSEESEKFQNEFPFARLNILQRENFSDINTMADTVKNMFTENSHIMKKYIQENFPQDESSKLLPMVYSLESSISSRDPTKNDSDPETIKKVTFLIMRSFIKCLIAKIYTADLSDIQNVHLSSETEKYLDSIEKLSYNYAGDEFKVDYQVTAVDDAVIKKYLATPVDVKTFDADTTKVLNMLAKKYVEYPVIARYVHLINVMMSISKYDPKHDNITIGGKFPRVSPFISKLIAFIGSVGVLVAIGTTNKNNFSNLAKMGCVIAGGGSIIIILSILRNIWNKFPKRPRSGIPAIPFIKKMFTKGAREIVQKRADDPVKLGESFSPVLQASVEEIGTLNEDNVDLFNEKVMKIFGINAKFIHRFLRNKDDVDISKVAAEISTAISAYPKIEYIKGRAQITSVLSKAIKQLIKTLLKRFYNKSADNITLTEEERTMLDSLSYVSKKFIVHAPKEVTSINLDSASYADFFNSNNLDDPTLPGKLKSLLGAMYGKYKKYPIMINYVGLMESILNSLAAIEEPKDGMPGAAILGGAIGGTHLLRTYAVIKQIMIVVIIIGTLILICLFCTIYPKINVSFPKSGSLLRPVA
jgi:hypothetical protein